MSRIREVDGLRAIALISVLGYHGRFANFLSGGFLGVDIFFVISGFVITLSLRKSLTKGYFSFHSFFVRRLYRLIPSLLATLLVSNLLCSLLFSIDYRKEAAYLALSSIFSVSNIHLWLQAGYFDSSAILKPYLHTWSLSIEWQFYILWAILCRFILFPMKSNRRCGLLLLALTVTSILFTEAIKPKFPTAAFYLIFSRFSEFMFGAIPAWLLYTQEKNNSLLNSYRVYLSPNFISFVAAAVIAIFLGLFRENYSFPGLSAIPVCLSTVILISFSEGTQIGNFLLHPVLQWLGKVSYSVYLVHWPLLVLLEYYDMSHSTVKRRALALTISIVIGWILNLSVELPFQEIMKQGNRGKRTKKYTLLISFLLLLVQVCNMQFEIIPIVTPFSHQQNAQVMSVINYTRILGKYRKTEIRKRCFATRRFHNVDHFDECSPPAEKEFIIIGDSHAGDMWYAFNKTFPNITIMQLTGADCTFGKEFPTGGHCHAIFSNIPKLLSGRTNRIKAVFILGHWTMWERQISVDLSLLRNIIKYFNKNTDAEIFVFEAWPEFEPPPLEVALRYRDRSIDEIDKEAQRYLIVNEDSRKLLRQLLDGLKIKIVPTLDVLCKKSVTEPLNSSNYYCPTLDAKKKAFMHFDRHHFNREGGFTLLRKLAKLRYSFLSYSNLME